MTSTADLNGAGKPHKDPDTQRHFSDLSTALARAAGPRDWLFEGAIEGSPIIAFPGPEKRGKSWIWIDASVAAVTGGAWLGAFPCRRRGAVVYLDGEYGEVEFARRLARVCRGRGVRPSSVLGAVRHYRSTDLLFARGDQAFRWLVEECRTLRPALIVVDPWRNHTPGDENSVTDTIDAMRLVAQLREVSGAGIVLIHHLNKEGKQSGARAFLTRADLIIEGSDKSEPWYDARGRTLRSGDRIQRSFTVRLNHENDGDETCATTVLSARFAGESQPEVQTIGKTARRVLAALEQEPSGLIGINEIKRRSRVTNTLALHRGLDELTAARLAIEAGGKWKAGGS